MKRLKKTLTVTLIALLICNALPTRSQIDLDIHYLGHSSFLIDFNDYTAVTDFGTSYCWGYNSPIYGFGDYVPTIMSFSHYHDDHYDPDRLPGWIPFELDPFSSLSITNLLVSPVRTCENTVGVESNSSFTYNFAGYRIVHLGDAQAEIMNIADPAQQALILGKFPDRIDVLLMTIEGINQFIPEAEMFIDLLQPGIVIPMHYWSPEYKEEFLAYLELQNDTAGKNYIITRHDGPVLTVNSGDTIHNQIIVYSLTPFPYGETGIEDQLTYGSTSLSLLSYPNPCRDQLSIQLESKKGIILDIAVHSITGEILLCNRSRQIRKGITNIKLNIASLAPGTYILNLKNDRVNLSNKFIVIK